MTRIVIPTVAGISGTVLTLASTDANAIQLINQSAWTQIGMVVGGIAMIVGFVWWVANDRSMFDKRLALAEQEAKDFRDKFLEVGKWQEKASNQIDELRAKTSHFRIH